MKKREGSVQNRTLEAIKASGEMTVKGLQDVLQMPESHGYARICHAIRDLLRAGYIERSGRALYRYLGEPKGANYAEGQQRMIRVIRIRTKRREPFTARQLAELAEVSFDWAKRYINLVIKSGHLDRSGSARTPNNVPQSLYLAAEDRLNDEWPLLRRHAKTEVVDQAVAKVRDLSLRVAADCRTCLSSMLEVREALKTMMDAVDGTIDLIREQAREPKKGTSDR